MQPKVILPTLAKPLIPGNGATGNGQRATTDLGQYMPAQFSGENESGFYPLGERVLVLPDQPVEKHNDLIDLPDEIRERMAYAAETGTLVALGPDAFRFTADRMRKLDGERPTIGTRVFFDRYGGGMIHGMDGRIYRVMEDKCVGAECRSKEMVSARVTKRLATS